MDKSRRTGVAHRLGAIIDLGIRMVYRVEVRGLEHFSRSPSTLVVANHRRDTDGPIIGGVLLGRRGFNIQGVMPYFVAREDLFRKGFLREYLETWPPLVRELLSPINLRSFLHGMHAFPMRRIPERTLGEVLEDVLHIFGDLRLSGVLKPTWVDQFDRLAPARERHALTVRKALARRYRLLHRQRYGLTKLTRSRFVAIKPYERDIIESHLQCFVDLLEQGKTVQLEPEGTVSTDGSFLRLRGGLHVLLNRPITNTRVLPIGITYDFMTTGRQTVFVSVGPEMSDLKGIPRRHSNTQVAQAILAQSTVTASQLASQFLLAMRSSGQTFLASELIDHVSAEARRCAKAGAYVDPRLLTEDLLEPRVHQCLRYCLRSGMLFRDGDFFHCLRSSTQTPLARWTDPEGAIDYLNNELTSLRHLWPSVAESLEA